MAGLFGLFMTLLAAGGLAKDQIDYDNDFNKAMESAKNRNQIIFYDANGKTHFTKTGEKCVVGINMANNHRVVKSYDLQRILYDYTAIENKENEKKISKCIIDDRNQREIRKQKAIDLGLNYYIWGNLTIPYKEIDKEDFTYDMYQYFKSLGIYDIYKDMKTNDYFGLHTYKIGSQFYYSKVTYNKNCTGITDWKITEEIDYEEFMRYTRGE